MIGSSTLRAPSVSRELEAEVGGGVADVALGKPQEQHLLGPERTDADARGDAGVDAARDRDDGAAAAEAADRVGGLRGQPVDAGGRVEVGHGPLGRAMSRSPHVRNAIPYSVAVSICDQALETGLDALGDVLPR